jgi:hypothetical protein
MEDNPPFIFCNNRYLLIDIILRIKLIKQKEKINMEMINSITAFIIGYVGMVFCIVGYYRLKRYLRLAKEKHEAIHNVKTDMREKKIMGCANLLLAIPMGGLAPHSIRMCVLGGSMLCNNCF